MIECFYFEDNGHKLFGALHSPASIRRKKSVGVVFCAPFAEEKLWAQRIYTNFAQYLSEKGFSVLRFDYFGHGDSDGNFEDADILSRLQNISCAVNLLREKENIGIVGVFGLRFGATLAALSAEQGLGIDFLLLWEPIIQGEKYIKECLRTNLTYQTATYKKIFYTRNQMVEDLMSDRPVNIDGYLLTGKLFRQIGEINLSGNILDFAKPVQIIHLCKNYKKKTPEKLIELHKKYSQLNILNDFQKIQAEPFWGSTKNYYQRNNELFEISKKWLDSNIALITC